MVVCESSMCRLQGVRSSSLGPCPETGPTLHPLSALPISALSAPLIPPGTPDPPSSRRPDSQRDAPTDYFGSPPPTQHKQGYESSSDPGTYRVTNVPLSVVSGPPRRSHEEAGMQVGLRVWLEVSHSSLAGGGEVGSKLTGETFVDCLLFLMKEAS
ncbi:hypothetical protein BaRGS_00000738 [Batillaria attramentaria]|uniref:Uncharacterized protein n=1 Tax=Batillaria attramentaria TaxID=370345 RepID=A0ABD0M7M5_9CAEN